MSPRELQECAADAVSRMAVLVGACVVCAASVLPLNDMKGMAG